MFGNTARGETRGTDSDVDVFAVVEDDEVVDPLRNLAYDVTLDYGVVVSVHKVDSLFERSEGFVERVTAVAERRGEEKLQSMNENVVAR